MIGHPPAFGGSLRASESIDLTSRSRLERQARSRPTYARLRPDRGRLGPGPIPAEADATIELGAAQAEAIHRGQLL